MRRVLTYMIMVKMMRSLPSDLLRDIECAVLRQFEVDYGDVNGNSGLGIMDMVASELMNIIDADGVLELEITGLDILEVLSRHGLGVHLDSGG